MVMVMAMAMAMVAMAIPIISLVKQKILAIIQNRAES
jgi:hypothetical protein